MRKCLVVTLFLLFSSCLFAQHQEQGIIVSKIPIKEHNCCVLLPPDGFTLYDSPNGEEFFRIWMRPISDRYPNEYERVRIGSGDDECEYDDEDDDYDYFGKDHLRYTSFYNVACYRDALIYHQHVDGHVAIMHEGMTFWIKVEDIEHKGYTLKPWVQYLEENEHPDEGAYIPSHGIYYYEEPSFESKVLGFAYDIGNGHKHRIQLTGERQGGWFKAVVSEWRNEDVSIPCWIKAISDNGSVNIFWVSSRCGLRCRPWF